MLLSLIAVLYCIDEIQAQASGKAFATHGTEKMVYAARMAPQAVLHKDVLYIVYQADRTKSIGNPHIIRPNNPSPVWTSDGKPLEDWLVFYGWPGPRSIDDYIRDDKKAFHNTGKAFLWHDGEFK